MAADQRKRRPSSVTAPFGYGIQEPHRVKKREFRSMEYDFSFDNHVVLRWDDNQKRVVAKEEQIGLSSKDLALFGPVSNAKLADVLTLPKEVFDLSDLSEVLSYEVWQTILSEEDRRYLVQFLPNGFKVNDVVEDLLGGNNFHFGNPSLKWGSSLCSGYLHPDAIVQHEKSFKDNRKAYCSELQQYHDNMINNLQKIKERCVSSNDPEGEILNITSRPKGNTEINIQPDGSGFKSHKLEENAMYESLPSIADEKSYYSDNQKLSAIRDAEIQRRMRNQEHEKGIASPDGFKGISKAKKVEKLQKANNSYNDGTQYMSYVKISKKQHELVKSMKQNGASIQSKNLNRLLGSLDSFNVKPYEMFVEEEQTRIHEHWTSIVHKDLPSALVKWRNEQLERLHIMGFLRQEMEDKQGLWKKFQDNKLVQPVAEAPKVDAEDCLRTAKSHHDAKSASQTSVSDSEKELNQCSLQNETSKLNTALYINELDVSSLQNSPLDVNKEFDPCSSANQTIKNRPFCVSEEFDLSSMEHQSFQHSPLNVNQESYPSPILDQATENLALRKSEDFSPMDLNAKDSHQISSESSDSPEQHFTQTSEASLNVPHTETRSSDTGACGVVMPGSSVKNVWSPIGLPESCDPAQPTVQYASSGELSIRRHPQVVPQQPVHLIDLESDLPERGTTIDLLNTHTNPIPFLDSCAKSNRNELLQTLVKCDNFHQQQEAFHPTNVMLPSQFPHHFRDPILPSFALDHRQIVQSEFINPNIQASIYPDSRFSVQGQEHFSALNAKDRSNAHAHMLSPMQSQLNSGGLLNHNWPVNDNRAHSGWTGLESSVFPSTGLVSGSNADQSLYSVLSQCTSLQSRSPFNNMGLSEQMIPSTSFGQDLTTRNPVASNSMPQAASPFDYLSGGEATTTLKNPNMGWMSLGNQGSTLHDPSGKPFL